ncbi:monofunctional biosynthetic peptidoglycan transglycosylase [Oleiagrimonas sp. C23AA]|uniref:monofunctional biosynthetic peptidoglycan transglycosylase n=1 Tax=Oleiagrimonas sp. C23AA TaxID=2719047 RepID=UPI0014205103|nr:monofunctional biosynthetic peptidoglycan transglycosylase [Oleiagrimonas sp. C23AA]NII12115.1 monofunctional biosynthetic peptidoglycan transglycosylase [Oleiagrimonas sp. C23AA]
MPALLKRPRRRWLRWLIYLIGAWLVLTWLPVVIFRFVPPPTSAFMIERHFAAWRHGEKHFELHQHWVPWRAMNKQVPLAMVASEDQRFPFHHGFDFHAIHKAIDTAEDGGRLRGASTISQQTAKNLFLWGGRNFVRKGLEAYFTVLLELTWPKHRILEVYANICQLGDNVYGVGAAGQQLFGTDQARLSEHQAALLAAVLPNPKRLHAARPSAYVQHRAAWIERQMRQLGGTAYVTSDHPTPPRNLRR